MVEWYETLRREVLDKRRAGTGREGRGLTLLRERGLSAWMRGCAMTTPPPTRPLSRTAREAGEMTEGVRADMTAVLAAMALSAAQELIR